MKNHTIPHITPIRTMPKDEKNASSCHNCQCCGPTEYEFPDDLLTPELKKMKASMSPEEFEAFMKAMM